MRLQLKILFILNTIFFLLVLTSCTAENIRNDININNGATNSGFDARKVSIGDSINNLFITSLSVNSIDQNEYFASVHFNGEMTLSGELFIDSQSEVAIEGWGLGNFFQPDKQSSIMVPVLKHEAIKTGFTIEDNIAEQLKALHSGKYEVTLIVEQFQIWSLGKGQENKAVLVELIEVKNLIEE